MLLAIIRFEFILDIHIFFLPTPPVTMKGKITEIINKHYFTPSEAQQQKTKKSPQFFEASRNLIEDTSGTEHISIKNKTNVFINNNVHFIMLRGKICSGLN